MNKKRGGSVRIVRTPKTSKACLTGDEKCLRQSAIRHAVRLAMSDGSVRKILHLDLHFYHYKIQIVYFFNSAIIRQSDFVRVCSRGLTEMQTKLTTRGWTMKHSSTYQVFWIYNTNISQMPTFVFFMKHLFAFKNLQYGVLFQQTEWLWFLQERDWKCNNSKFWAMLLWFSYTTTYPFSIERWHTQNRDNEPLAKILINTMNALFLSCVIHGTEIYVFKNN